MTLSYEQANTPMTDAELLAIKPNSEPGHWHPFAPWRSGHPDSRLGKREETDTIRNNAGRWVELHDPEMVEEINALNMQPRDAIALDLRVAKLGWRRQVNPETGDVAIFPSPPNYAPGAPEEKVAAEAWAERCADMHANQRHFYEDPLSPLGYSWRKQPHPGEEPVMDYAEYTARQKALAELEAKKAEAAKQREQQARENLPDTWKKKKGSYCDGPEPLGDTFNPWKLR